MREIWRISFGFGALLQIASTYAFSHYSRLSLVFPYQKPVLVCCISIAALLGVFMGGCNRRLWAGSQELTRNWDLVLARLFSLGYYTFW